MAENLQADAEKDDKAAPRSRTQSKIGQPDQSKVGQPDLTKDNKADDDRDDRRDDRRSQKSDKDDDVTVSETVDPIEYEKSEPSEKDKKRAERRQKLIDEQGEQDEADIEAFLAAKRGEEILRGQDGSFDHIAFRMAQREERLAKVREEAGDDEEDQERAVREAEADEKTREEASGAKSQELGTKDAIRRQG